MRTHNKLPRISRGIFAIGIAACILLSGCAGDSSSSESGSGDGDVPVVRIAGPTQTTSAAAFTVALDKGYFDDAGVRVEYGELKSGSDAIALLASGKLDATIGGPSVGMFNALNRGLGFRWVATISTTHGVYPGTGDLFTAKRSKISSVEDLRGKKIAMNGGAGSSTGFYVSNILAQAGMTLDDVEVVEIGPTDLEPAFRSGAIDAAIPGYPLAIQLSDLDLIEHLASTDPGYSALGILYSDAFRKTEGAQRFFDAMVRASKDLEGAGWTSPDVEKILADRAGLPLDLLKRNPPTKMPAKLDPAGDGRGFESWQQVYIDAGLADYDEVIPDDKILDTTFSQAAKQ